MKLAKLFKSQQPDVAQVEAQITALADKRAGLQADLDRLQSDMVASYGDDDTLDTLALKIAATEAKVTGLAAVSSELESERQAAVLRGILADVKARYAEAASMVERVIELNPLITDAFSHFEALVIESNTLRNQVSRKRRPEAIILREALTAAGLDPAQHIEQLKSQADALKADYPGVDRSLADNAGEAQAAARLGFAAPDSGLIKEPK